MARTLKSDKMLFWATIFLVCTSVVMVYSASAVRADDVHQSSTYNLLRQSAWASLGLIALLTMMRVDYHQFRRPEVVWSLLSVALVALVAVFLFDARKGSHRWIGIGPFSWQPSELAKFVAICFVAAVLERRMHRVNDLKYALLPVGIVTLLIALLILAEPDLGTASVLVIVVCTMVFAAGLSYRYLFGAALVMLPALMVLIVAFPYRRDRLVAFLDPWADPLGKGYQVIQSLMAVGSGGLFGQGLMAGVQKLFYLPEAHNDFIFAVIGEEFGLLGTTVTLLCFCLIAWRGLRAALLAPDRFGALLAIGLTGLVAIQALINICVVLGMLPTKGIPLPLVSAGGSSLVVNLIGMGVLLNISQQAVPVTAATPVMDMAEAHG